MNCFLVIHSIDFLWNKRIDCLADMIRRYITMTKKFMIQYFESPRLILGRWFLDYRPKIIHKKIDQANTDHCGVCHTTQKSPKNK